MPADPPSLIPYPGTVAQGQSGVIARHGSYEAIPPQAWTAFADAQLEWECGRRARAAEDGRSPAIQSSRVSRARSLFSVRSSRILGTDVGFASAAGRITGTNVTGDRFLALPRRRFRLQHEDFCQHGRALHDSSMVRRRQRDRGSTKGSPALSPPAPIGRLRRRARHLEHRQTPFPFLKSWSAVPVEIPT